MNDSGWGAEVPLALVVCDDRAEVREAITRAVADLPRFEVVGEAVDGVSCLAQIRDLQPDILSVDVSMPGGGPDLIRAIRLLDSVIHIVVFSGRDDRRLLNEMLAAGADEYVVKTGRLRPLIDAFERAPSGHRQQAPEA